MIERLQKMITPNMWVKSLPTSKNDWCFALMIKKR